MTMLPAFAYKYCVTAVIIVKLTNMQTEYSVRSTYEVIDPLLKKV